MRGCATRVVKKLLRDESRKLENRADILTEDVTDELRSPRKRHSLLNMRLEELARTSTPFIAAWLFLGQLTDIEKFYNTRGMDNQVLDLIRDRLQTTLYDAGIVEDAPKKRLLEKDVTVKEILMTARALERTDFAGTPGTNIFHMKICMRLSEQWHSMRHSSRDKILFERLLPDLEQHSPDKSPSQMKLGLENLFKFIKRRIRAGEACQFERDQLKQAIEMSSELEQEDRDRHLVLELTKIAILFGIEPPPVQRAAFTANMLLYIEKQRSCNHLIALPFQPQKSLRDFTKSVEKSITNWCQLTEEIYQENRTIWQGKVQPTIIQCLNYLANGDTSGMPESTVATLDTLCSQKHMEMMMVLAKAAKQNMNKRHKRNKRLRGFRLPMQA